MTQGNQPVWHRSAIDDLVTIRAFVAVVEGGSFSEASRLLRVVPSTISKHIAALEARISGQLIVRSTKKLSVTELGQRFYKRCVTVLQDVAEAEIEVGEYNAEPQGILRVTAPTVFAVRHLSSIFAEFLKAYPRVKLDIRLSTETIDIIENGIDVGIRIGDMLAPGLIALRLAPNVRVFCASPAYIAQNGRPETIADLAQHNCITRGELRYDKWPASDDEAEQQFVATSGNITVNNGEMIREMLLAGLGVAYVSRFLVDHDIREGRLVDLFPDHRATTSNIYVVYPERRNLPRKTRAFVDFLKEAFRQPKEWIS